MSNTMWGGRFTGRPAEAMEEINASIDFDRKLAAQDIAGSEAHLAMLARQGIVEAADAEAIAKGLAQVKGEIEAGTFSFSRALEDIHMNVESRLAEIVGPERIGGEAHGGVVFCADLIPGRPWVHVPITMGYDRNAELLIDEKREFLDDKLARNVHLFFTHDPECALAQVTRDAKGKFGTAHEVAELHARALAA